MSMPLAISYFCCLMMAGNTAPSEGGVNTTIVTLGVSAALDLAEPNIAAPAIVAARSVRLKILERIPVIWKRRRVGKAKRAHQGRGAVGTAREERAFAHPTSASGRSKSALAAAIIASRQASASAVMIAPPIVLLALFIDFYLPNRRFPQA